MYIYLDNCCFNRPFDDQSSIRIKLETDAKLYIQEQIRHQKLELAWSYPYNDTYKYKNHLTSITSAFDLVNQKNF